MSSRAHRVSLGDSWSQRVHPDIESERRRQAFDVERLTNLLDRGARNTTLRREVESLFRSDPAFSLVNTYFMTQKEHFQAAAQKRFLLHKMAQRLNWPEDGLEIDYARRALSGDIILGVHTVATKAIISLGSEEQIAKWVPLCKTYQIIATYAQTEMGHVGCLATHAIVMAQLICSGAKRGMHAFVVPIRSPQDHTPLPGITAGDIGPRMGLENADNGFLQLDHVRVPRENMLSRFAQVLPDGTYIRCGTAQSNYLPMVVTRVDILTSVVLPSLQKACVIATRYSVIRRQGRLRPSDPEAKILDYQTQQQKLLFPLAMSYAFHFQAVSLLEFFQHAYNAVQSNDTSLLPELHVLTTGSKAMMTDFCAYGVELCRRACGGHGYSKLSGLPSLATQVVASCTYEGENTVLYLQVARFLMKNYQQIWETEGAHSQRSLPQSVQYFTMVHHDKCPAQNASDFLLPEIYTTAWAHTAARLVEDSARHLQVLTQSGADQQDAWNQTSVSLVQAAKAHCYYVTVKSFQDAVKKLDSEPAIQLVLKRLCDLFALHGILADSGIFLYDGFLSGPQVDMVRTAYLDLLSLIRKDAVLLTDAFDFTDQCLNSALGCYDGNVYERLFQWAQMSPNNNSQMEASLSHCQDMEQRNSLMTHTVTPRDPLHTNAADKCLSSSLVTLLER
uniref:Acyl-coenzyme A oxidase n=1 Tax=Cavia porcellus TaxID=10141 RepID=A0A286XDD7_CAVPO